MMAAQERARSQPFRRDPRFPIIPSTGERFEPHFNVTFNPKNIVSSVASVFYAFHSTSRERGARKNVFGKKCTSWPPTRRRVGIRELTSSKTTRASNRARKAPRQK